MKAKIKATGEIINIASYAKITLDKCDSYGTPIEVRPEEVELIANMEEDEHWQDVRERAAIAAMQGILSNSDAFKQYATNKEYKKMGDVTKVIALSSCMYADALIEQLKK